jgi:hypothetical protein
MTSVTLPRAAALCVALFAGGCASPLPAIDLDPANTGNSAPAQKYQSVFANYRGFTEAAPIPWRRANERAARLGGHAGILKAPVDANAEDTDD